jgi:hypothetical protein
MSKRMRCYVCAMRIVATIEKAKAHGWTLWVGGATCKTCSEKEQTPSTAQAAS